MPVWTPVDRDFEPHPPWNDVFVKSRLTFSADSFGKRSAARDKDRQQHFSSEICRLAEELGTTLLPVYVDFAGEKRRMDKGCIGHAVSDGILAAANGRNGYVEHVQLLRRPPH